MRSAEPVPSAATNTLNPSVRSLVSRRPSASVSPTTGIERARREHGRVGIVGAAQHRHRSAPSCARASGRTATTAAATASRSSCRAPRGGERLRERGLFVEQLLRAVAQAAGLERRDDRARRQQVGQQMLVGATATAATTPCRRRSGPPPAAPTAPNPTAASAAARPRALRTSSVGEQLAHREEPRLVDRDRGTLVGDRELRQPVDLVAPQVDAHRVVGGRRVDVDDRAAHRDLAARLHLVLAPVAHRHELVDELVAVELRRRARRRSARTPRRAGRAAARARAPARPRPRAAVGSP